MCDWNATKEEKNNYTSELHKKLNFVKCPESMLHCHDPLCTDSTHSDARDTVMLDILSSIVETSYTMLPVTGGVPSPLTYQKSPGTKQRRREIIPGWSKEVEPFRLHSNTCYRAWVASGKSRQGEAFKEKLKSHALFRYAVRRVKRASELHQARGLFNATMAGKLSLMKEMRRVKSGLGQKRSWWTLWMG